MKKLLLLSALMSLLFAVEACAMSKKKVTPKRKESSKMWDFQCDKQGVLDWKNKVCSKRCVKYKGKKCISWEKNIKDLKKDFDFFKKGNFLIVPEKLIR